jgi:hypothetical protein
MEKKEVRQEKHLLSENAFKAIRDIVLASTSREICAHTQQALMAKGIDAEYFEKLEKTVLPIQQAAEQNVFFGKAYDAYQLSLSQYALIGEAKERTIKKTISDVELKIKYIEENPVIDQERSVPIYIYLGQERLSIDEFAANQKEKSDNYYVKFVGFLSSEWLWPLGLDYDFEKGSIVDKQTREVPSQERLETILQSDEQIKARESFIKMAKTKTENQNPLMAENADFKISYAVVNTAQRERAKPISLAPM